MGNPKRASLIHNLTGRRVKQGNLVRIRKKVPTYKPPKWQDLTYKSKEITPHIKSEQRGKKVVTKTTYHSVKNPDNLSKRKLKKEFEAGNTPLHSSGASQTFITQKKKTKYHDSRRWNDKVQDRKNKQVEHTTGQTLASQKKDSSYDTKTTYKSKSKYLRANKEGKAIVKEEYEDSGIKGLKNVRVRGKVDREAANIYKHPLCGKPFGNCPNHADGLKGTIGNKPLKTTHVRTYKKGTSADDAFVGTKNPSGNPLAMNEMIGHSIKKIKGKSYGDKRGTQSIVGHKDGKAPQHKSNRGKVNKKKIKFHDKSTIKLKQNIFGDNQQLIDKKKGEFYLAQERSPIDGYIKAKDFRKLKRDPHAKASFENWKKTGQVDRNRLAKKK
jgi:hypothetical protein